MDRRVSVIIPSYNHAQFVGEAIRSVLNQSYSSIEFLVADDASQDGSVDVIRAVKDPRVRLEVFPSNRGLSLAMNAAILSEHTASLYRFLIQMTICFRTRLLSKSIS